MALEINSYVYTTTSGNHHYKQFPFTIIPITEGALDKTNLDIAEKTSTPKPPDLTFHCMCCEEYFISPLLMYEHLNTKHSDLSKPQESEEELDDNRDYSWVFEPVCELVAPEEGGPNITNDQLAEGEGEDSDSDDSESDDDTSTSSSSSSSSSSSDTSSNTISDSNTQDGLTRDSVIADKSTLAIEDTTTMVMEESAYEKAHVASLQFQNPESEFIQLKVADPRESTSIIILNPPLADDIKPALLTQPVRRGRGRRSAAQQAAIEMSSLISGEPKCFQCSHCEVSFPSAGDLSKHVRCHITNKPFQCSICEKTFTHIGSLNTHIRIHSGEKPYKCELCSKAFTQSSSLMVHLRSHSIKKPHQCHLCDKGFVNSTSLVIHLKTHKYGSRYSCSECDKSFKHEAQLKEHMRMHNQTLVYQCSICRNAFASSSELVQHMKCHMGEKPFTCSICDRSFTQSGSLNIHMRIHTGEKPFNCKLCNKSFTQASSLSVHMKIHSGEKPFPCNICGKCYSQAAYLNKHIQHHIDAQKAGLEPACPVPNETLLCIVCGDLHRDATSLALHVTQMHAALLHNIKENQYFNNSEISEEHLQQKQKYIEQMKLLMQMQQQMSKHTQQQEQLENSDQVQIKEEEMEEMEEQEVDEQDIEVQKPRDVEGIANRHLEGKSEPDQLNIESLQQQTEGEQEEDEENEVLYEKQLLLINNRSDMDPYINESEFEEDDDEEGDINDIKMLNANNTIVVNNANNGFITEMKDIEMSEYPFLEDAEYDDYAAEEEVETEE